MIHRQSSLFPVRLMCEVLEVSPSGYYDWIERQPSVREKRRDELAAEIRTIHTAVKKRYGSPRMHAELVAQGHACSRNTVAKIMNGLGIQAISHKKFRVGTTDSNHDFPSAANVVDRVFTALKPNELWLSDMTYIPTREGWLDLAVVEDLDSRRVVGWSMGGDDGEPPRGRCLGDGGAAAIPRRRSDPSRCQRINSGLTLRSSGQRPTLRVIAVDFG